jgi:hypothetical protein
MTIDTTIPAAARCSFCHSYQPLRRALMNPVDDYTETWRFFCDATCEANWGTNQPPPPPGVTTGRPSRAKR